MTKKKKYFDYFSLSQFDEVLLTSKNMLKCITDFTRIFESSKFAEMSSDVSNLIDLTNTRRFPSLIHFDFVLCILSGNSTCRRFLSGKSTQECNFFDETA